MLERCNFQSKTRPKVLSIRNQILVSKSPTGKRRIVFSKHHLLVLWVVVELWRRRSVNTSRHPSARAQAHPVQARNFTLLRLLRAVLNLHYCFCSQPDIADPFDEPLYAWATHPPNMFCVLSRFCVARETFSSTLFVMARRRQMAGTKLSLSPTSISFRRWTTMTMAHHHRIIYQHLLITRGEYVQPETCK